MKSKIAAFPYLAWMIIFIILPLFIVIYFGVTVEKNGVVTFSLVNFKEVFTPDIMKVFLRSIWLAFISTVICLILGYPLALILSGDNFKMKETFMMLLIIPMWMNFLLRTYAWLTLLGKNGFLVSLLTKLSLVRWEGNQTYWFFGPEFSLLYNEGAIILGMVYNFLPFMVLPIHSVVTKIDRRVVEAAEDLGANKYKVFLKVIFPLSLPGIISGITMVFLPAVTTFSISELLGGSKTVLIGNLIEQKFIKSNNWHLGSTISMVMMFVILICIGISSFFDKDKEKGAEKGW